MRLELNLPALDRLIGGDSEIECKLRDGIVEEFCKKRLKTVLNNSAYQLAMKAAEKVVNEAASEAIDVSELVSQKTLPIASSRLKSIITKFIDETINERVNVVIAAIIAKYTDVWDGKIKKAIEEGLLDKIKGAEIESQIREGIKKRLEIAKWIGDSDNETDRQEMKEAVEKKKEAEQK